MSDPIVEFLVNATPSTLGVKVQLTSIITAVELAPPELFAQTVNESVEDVTFSGAPQMLPLLVPNDKPVGRLGVIA